VRDDERFLLDRRAWLRCAMGAAGAAGVLGLTRRSAIAAPSAAADPWNEFRGLFELDASLIHLAGLLIAPHPRPVREAIEHHRAGFEADPAGYVESNHRAEEMRARRAAARYLGAKPEEIALVFNTTTGLGLVYGGIAIRANQRFLTTTHDYVSTHVAIQQRADRVGAQIDTITLYDDPRQATTDEMVERLIGAVTPRTRVVALTWVHSSTGVKLPVRRIADALAERNAGRDAEDRALLCIDGVHGLGVEDVNAGDLGCDVLVAGTHKWLFGPRGTGIVWAREAIHDALTPIIHSFTGYAGWGGELSPGGFHAFDHRWALAEAFALHERYGKAAIAERIRELNTRFKDALAELPHVTLLTPRDPALSAGIVCFQVRGNSPRGVVDRLRGHQIVAGVTPYRPPYARLSPGLLNNPDEVDAVIEALDTLR
jgi:isopenicillin-N epimerase